MLLLLLASLVGAWAVPISTGPVTAPTMAHTIIWGIEARDAGCSLTERTLFSIIRSCLLTIAACVYRAIHQNIPDPKAGWWKRQAIRAKITFYALMAPEMMIWWAMRQWFGAKEVADQVNAVYPDLKWTRTHGHFAQMGGFGFRSEDDNQGILYPPTLIQLLRENKAELGQGKMIDMEELKRVSEEKINDSSKGDLLSKGIVALQTTWFVFECLARLQQNLPLLELEVVTLAFAVLNILTYLFWWDKPLNVRCPVYLRTLSSPKAPASPGTPSKPKKEKTKTKGGVHVVWKAVVERIKGAFRTAWRGLGAIAEGTVRAVKTVWEGVCAVGNDIKKDIKDDGWWLTVWTRLIGVPLNAVIWPLFELLRDSEVHDDATHVSIFYGMQISDEKGSVALFSSCFIGMIFGATHFLSWHSAFPTHAQLLLWRISSIVLVAEPCCLALEKVLYMITGDVPSFKRRKFISSITILFGLIPLGFGPIIYILARMCLLVLAFLTLRNPPPPAFQTISWTTYIPHL
ncbi:hypothetical protein BDN72DRAFT_597188 [Pluteus cervinus]|uniref:Uncharacterized protein n=1 Tax=Pluteus cervinus TaxID=181527 RepID=A0ACD3A1K7_9AGAR|nr:hypothetical protein BDN72DRAFT_597188 [Pluteus cervinus]